MGTSYTDYKKSGFWTRDAALETVLAMIVIELQHNSLHNPLLDRALDHWTLQSTAGFGGAISLSLDEYLGDETIRSIVKPVLSKIIDITEGPERIIKADDPQFRERAERLGSWSDDRVPQALSSWVHSVSATLLDLINENLKVPSTGSFWWADERGHRQRSKA